VAGEKHDSPVEEFHLPALLVIRGDLNHGRAVLHLAERLQRSDDRTPQGDGKCFVRRETPADFFRNAYGLHRLLVSQGQLGGRERVNFIWQADHLGHG